MGDYLLLEWPSGLSCKLIWCLVGHGYILFVVCFAWFCFLFFLALAQTPHCFSTAKINMAGVCVYKKHIMIYLALFSIINLFHDIIILYKIFYCRWPVCISSFLWHRQHPERCVQCVDEGAFMEVWYIQVLILPGWSSSLTNVASGEVKFESTLLYDVRLVTVFCHRKKYRGGFKFIIYQTPLCCTIAAYYIGDEVKTIYSAVQYI